MPFGCCAWLSFARCFFVVMTNKVRISVRWSKARDYRVPATKMQVILVTRNDHYVVFRPERVALRPEHMEGFNRACPPAIGAKLWLVAEP